MDGPEVTSRDIRKHSVWILFNILFVKAAVVRDSIMTKITNIIRVLCDIAIADAEDDFPGVPVEGAVLPAVTARCV